VPIKMGNNFLIILVNDKKEEAVAIDEDIRIEEIIRYETDRQLSQFSKVYYNKVKINTKISEL
jgi:peptidyl-prolyl cis-trans isomerase SurA